MAFVMSATFAGAASRAPPRRRGGGNGIGLRRGARASAATSASSHGGDAASAEAAVPLAEHLRRRRVIGLGAAGMDYLATVDGFPNADDKIRSTSLSQMGGGNCANTLTTVRRLGVACSLVTKLGDDSLGDAIVDELSRGEGVDCSFVRRGADMNSPFTYVIVDTRGGTRTCIHTAAREELTAEELEADVDAIFEPATDAAIVHLDGRQTLAAIALAKHANARGVTVTLDVEKPRPHLEQLLPLADVLITNSRFPLLWAPGEGEGGGEDGDGGNERLVEGMAALLAHGRARMVLSTLGARGSVLLRRHDEARRPRGAVHGSGARWERRSVDGAELDVVWSDAAAVKEIVDSTGAGDAFIGGVVYGLLVDLPVETMLALASLEAAKKLERPGARSGLPRREQVPASLLEEAR